MVFKGKEQSQKKMSRIEVPSDLSDRIQHVSEHTKLPYGELLQKWLKQEENVIAVERYKEDILQWKQHVEAQLIALQRQIFTLQGTPSSAGFNESEYRRSLLKKIKNLRDQGMTFVKISEQFNDEGIATVTGTGKWYPSSISQFLAKNGGI
ncbi:MAG: hypothetical protein LBS00_08555 [Synergistaceae bacterium]|nr:hypothetical protein [Synergistaceae bacterium]